MKLTHEQHIASGIAKNKKLGIHDPRAITEEKKKAPAKKKAAETKE